MITILHNPRCSTSRAALEELQSAGVEYDEVRYLDSPLNEQAALDLMDMLEDDPKDLVRRDDTFAELGLTEEDLQDRNRIAEIISEHPKVMQRPVLISEKRAIIGRPKDRVAPFIAEVTRS